MILILILLTQAWADSPPLSRYAESRDGRFQSQIDLWENWDEWRFFDNGKLRWRKLVLDIPDTIVVSNDGKILICFGLEGILLIDGETGEETRRFPLSARDAIDPPWAAWFSEDGHCYLMASGQLYLFELSRGKRLALEREKLEEVVRRGEHRAACLRLACIHGIALDGEWVSQPVTFEAVVYAALHGDDLGKELLQKRISRAHEVWLTLLGTSPFLHLPTAPQSGPLIPPTDDELIAQMKAWNSESAAIDLGLRRSQKAVPHLWEFSRKNAHFAAWALITILGRDALPGLLELPNWDRHDIIRDYLTRERHPEVIPTLLKKIEAGSHELYPALVFQTQIDLGRDVAKWREWYESSAPPAETLARLNEISGILLLGQQGKKASLEYLQNTPRMVAVLPNGAPGRLVIRNGEAFRTRGYAIDPVIGWKLADGQPSRFHSLACSKPMNYVINSQEVPTLEEPGWREDERWEAEGPHGESLFVEKGDVRLFLHKGTKTKDVGKAHTSDQLGTPTVSRKGFAFLNWDNQIEVKNWSGETLSAGLHSLRSPTFNPNGEHLAILQGRQIIILDTDHFKETTRIPFVIPSYFVSSLNFSEDGRYLCVGTEQAFYVWDLEPPPLPKAVNLQLATELWLGHRIEGGTARLQSHREYVTRQQSYQREQGCTWLAGGGEETNLGGP